MRLSHPTWTSWTSLSASRKKWLDALAIIRQAMEVRPEICRGRGQEGPSQPQDRLHDQIGDRPNISTNQLDFLATQTFDLKYIGEDGADHPVYVIHRAPLGTHERFTAFLIEHYAGAFPTWLAPVQVRVIPISEKAADYAQKVVDALFAAPVVNGTAGLRVDIDRSNERMQKKIRDAQLQKIPYMLVVGQGGGGGG
jgi:threonyl-tRNA synthetase